MTVFVLLVAACSYKPHARKEYNVTKWKYGKEASPGVSCPEKWWEIFADQDLAALEDEAIKSSPTLDLAVARLEEAKALYIQTRSAMFPQFDVSGFANRRRLSSSALSSTSSSATTTPSTATTTPTTPATSPTAATSATASAPKQHVSLLQVTPEVSYEVDFWGKYASATRAAGEQVKGAQEALRTAWLLLTTEVAVRYFELRSLDAQLDVLGRTCESYKAQYDINSAKFKAGLSSDLDALQAEYEYQRIRAQYESTIIERATAQDLLATVVGRPASHLEIAVKPFELHCADISCPLPMEVLKKRPDICEAEHTIEAARLNVGVAKTNFLPQITLTGNFGHQSNKARTLFEWKNHVLSGTASAFQPIFEGGLIIGQYKQAKAQYDEAIANWLDRVLVAYQEVEDSLISIETLKKQREIRVLELTAAQSQKKISLMRYERGLIDYLEVIFADSAELTSETNTIITKRDQILATINLIKSIGGTW